MVDFPAPEGAEITKQTPRRLTDAAADFPSEIMAAVFAPFFLHNHRRIVISRAGGVALLTAPG